jgi:hypothetical protein
MMGTKVRTFSPLPHDLSLEELVPKDSFYRRLEARLDLSFSGSSSPRSTRKAAGLRSTRSSSSSCSW